MGPFYPLQRLGNNFHRWQDRLGDPRLAGMATSATTRNTTATPAQVWAVLSDGHRYADWVHGTKEIRDVEHGWPAEGTSIHFTAGVGPFTFDEKTTSRHNAPEQALELEAHAWPAGSARIGIRISPTREGSIITMNEHPLRGPARWLHNPLTAVGFRLRVTLMLKDLARLAEAEPPG